MVKRVKKKFSPFKDHVPSDKQDNVKENDNSKHKGEPLRKPVEDKDTEEKVNSSISSLDVSSEVRDGSLDQNQDSTIEEKQQASSSVVSTSCDSKPEDQKVNQPINEWKQTKHKVKPDSSGSDKHSVKKAEPQCSLSIGQIQAHAEYDPKQGARRNESPIRTKNFAPSKNQSTGSDNFPPKSMKNQKPNKHDWNAQPGKQQTNSSKRNEESYSASHHRQKLDRNRYEQSQKSKDGVGLADESVLVHCEPENSWEDFDDKCEIPLPAVHNDEWDEDTIDPPRDPSHLDHGSTMEDSKPEREEHSSDQVYEHKRKRVRPHYSSGKFQGKIVGPWDGEGTSQDYSQFDKRSRSAKGRKRSSSQVDRYERKKPRLHYSCKQFQETFPTNRSLNYYDWSRASHEIRGKIDYKTVEERQEDLFAMDKEYSLAHCVAEDMGMGAGIALQFRRDFKRVDELLNQRQRQGGLAVLEDKGRYIYYLVTKRDSSGKPTYLTLFDSLVKMHQHMIEHGVKKLAIPRIGCGLDRLEWSDVKFMLEYIFKGSDVSIVVCNFQQDEESHSTPPYRTRNCKVVYENYSIEKILDGTIILYLTSEDGEMSDGMKVLDEKFNFKHCFNAARKELGRTILYEPNPLYKIYGCVVKKKSGDPIDFSALLKCVQLINKDNRKTGSQYIGMQAITDHNDDIIMSKVVNILRNGLRDVEVYICCPGTLQKVIPFNYRPSL